MLYTTLSPPTLKAVSELARHGAPHVVLHRFDDEPVRFREAIQRLPDQGLGDAVLEGIGPALALVPTSLALAIERLFRSPQLIRDTRALAESAGLNVRTVYRQLEAAGLASPRTLIVGARLLRAYSYLRDPGQSVESISLLLGYTEPRIFARNAREAFGLTPTALRHGMDSAAFVRRLIAFIHPAPDHSGEPSPDLGSPLVS
jgi:AraC-like DNA-binding protein